MNYERICKDCIKDWWKKHPTGLTVDMPKKWRPAPHPGPRCVTHHRAFKKHQSNLSHTRRTVHTYGLAPGEYEKLYAIQGGRCAGCKRAMGKSRRLAVDHDHAHCPGKESCGSCVRGLLCGRCNDTLAHFRDDPELLRGLATYLESWPSWQLPGRGRYRRV